MIEKPDVRDYSTLVFDCDGVVLGSNSVKASAFYSAALPYGNDAAQALVDYHKANGGVSRYKKFAHFIDTIVPKFVSNVTGPGLDGLLDAYSTAVRKGLLNCTVTAGLQELRAATPEARWLIVSGGDQTELREVFSQRLLITMFDGGVFGSPDTKDEILAREIVNGNINGSALFIGDSRYDHEASSGAGLDFLFVSRWTEFESWQSYCETHWLAHVPAIQDLLPGTD